MATEKIDLRIDPDTLTLGDLEDFEGYCGTTIDETIKPVPVLDDEGQKVFDKKGRPEMTVKVPTKALVCLVWLVKRHDDPTFTIEDARNVKVTSLVLADAPSQDAQGKS